MRLFKKVLAISMATALTFTGVEMPVNAMSNLSTQAQVVTETQTGVGSTDSKTTGSSTDTKTVVNESADTSTDSTATTGDTTTNSTATAGDTTTDGTATTGDTTTNGTATTGDTITNGTTTTGDTTTNSTATTGEATTTDKAATTDSTTKATEISELQKKINDALLVNGTISLTEDVKLDKMLELNLPENVEKAELTIELNNFKITSDVAEALMHVSENITLTIKGEGSMINTAENGIVIFNEGTINLENAQLLATGIKSIGVLNNSTLGEKGLIIKSGTIKAEWFAIGKTAKAEASSNRPTAFFAVAGIVAPATTTEESTTADTANTTSETTTDTTTTTDKSTSIDISADTIEQGTYSVDQNATVTGATENVITVTENATTPDSTKVQDEKTQQAATNETTSAANTTEVPAQQVTVIAPAMPLNVATTVNNYNSVKISWSPVTDAQGYIVERIQSGTETAFTALPAITATEYTDNNILVGKEYKYHVYAFITNGTDILKSAVSSDVTVKTTLAAPQALTAVQASATSVKLTWGAVNGAQKYNVYRSTKDGEFSLITTIEGTEYTNSGLKTGTNYGYKVAAVNGDYVTDYSNSVSLYAAATGVTKLKASSKAYNEINLSWKGAKGATQYAIYRSTNQNDGYKKIKSVTTNKYTDSKIKTGITYYYKVVSYSNKAKGGESLVVSAISKCAAPTNVKATNKSYNSAKITWTKVNGAGSYSIYRSTSKNGDYTFTGSVSKKKGSYTDKSVVSGTIYYYKVCAVSNGTEGKMSKVVSTKIKPSEVKNLAVKSAGGRDVRLTWTSANGAATYEVYYSKKENSGYKKYGETSDLNYTVTQLKNGRTYYYRVYAISNGIKSNPAQVTYVNPKSISLSASTLNLESGETEKLKVSFNPENASDKTITWSSANSKIATVSSKGEITALASGVTIITATACNGLTATCEVGVDQETSGVVIVLDPGHGGSDTGARAGSIYEKDLNLKISQYTKAELEKYSGVIVKMTRTDDTFVDLVQRTQIAKNYGANLFVSQHLNSGVSSASGAEVYVSLNGNYNAASTKLGSQITYRLAGIGLNNRGVKTRQGDDGDYYSVIRNSVARGIPGIIVEGAFLSNAEDREILSSEAGLKSIGVATATAIAEYYGLSKK